MAQDPKHDSKPPCSKATSSDNGQLEATLPNEILDLIVDELGSTAHQDSSREALRTLALVSTTFCRRAYKHLFSELKLVLADNIDKHLNVCIARCRETLRRLHELLSCGIQFPGTAMVYHLQGIQITIIFTNGQDVHGMTLLPELSGILDALHGVSHGITYLGIEVQIRDRTPNPEFPLHISKGTNPRLFAAFVSLCKSPKLTTLRLKNVSMESKTLCGTGIQSLHLDQFMVEDPHPSRLNRRTRPEPTTSVVQPVSLTLLDIFAGPTEHPTESTDLITDLVGFLYPSYGIDKPIDRPLVFANLSSLTLQDRDTTTQIELLPQLRSLNIRQSISSGRRNFGYVSGLPRFFIPRPGTVRNLGSVVKLTIMTELYSNHRDVIMHPRLEDAWNTVDLHLKTTVNCLQHVQLAFIFPLQSMHQCMAAEEGASDSPATSDTMRIVTAMFPRLSASGELPDFSVNVFATDKYQERKISTVRCRGLQTGWW